MVKDVSFKFQQFKFQQSNKFQIPTKAHLTCCFSTDSLKWDFLGIEITMFSGVKNFGNTSAISVIFFLKMFLIQTRFGKIKKKIEKKFFVFEIIASEFVALNCLYQEANTGHRYSVC